MAMKYFHCYYDNEVAVDRLTDAQAGRLFKALLDYASRREEGSLGAREQGIFDLMSLQIGRDQEKYDRMCAAQAERARKRWDRERDAMACHSCQEEDKEEDKEENKNENKNKNKDENEDKEKDEENQASPAVSPFIPLGETDMGFAEPLNSAFGDWLAYKQERRQTYKPKGLQNLYTQVRHAAERYGNAAVADCIRDSMACNYQGILFDRLKKTRKGRGSADNPFLEMLREAEGDHEPF